MCEQQWLILEEAWALGHVLLDPFSRDSHKGVAYVHMAGSRSAEKLHVGRLSSPQGPENAPHRNSGSTSPSAGA